MTQPYLPGLEPAAQTAAEATMDPLHWALAALALICGLVAALFWRMWSQANAAHEETRATLGLQIAERSALEAEFAAVRARLESRDEAHAREIVQHREAFEREKQAILAMKEELDRRFQALAGDALNKSQESFLRLANETFLKHREGEAEQVKAREEKLAQILKPVSQSFERFEQRVETLEKTRLEDRSQIAEQIKNVGEMLAANSDATRKLAFALKAKPQVRGRWAEEQLQNILELAGMSQYVDFTTQESARDEEQRLQRPDAVLRLPGGGMIVIDAKVSLEGFLDAAEAETEDERELHLARHAKHLREHMKGLASKSYWKLFDTSPDFVAMFVPGEHFFSAAMERDASLFQDAIEKRVIIVTPATLVALAKAVAFGWRQEAAAEAAQDIARLGKELYERLAVFSGHLEKVGKALDGGVKAFNSAVGSFDRRVAPQARKLRETGSFQTDRSLDELTKIELSPQSSEAALEQAEESAEDTAFERALELDLDPGPARKPRRGA